MSAFPDPSLGGPGQLSVVVQPFPSCTSLDQQKEEEKTEIMKLEQLSKGKIQAPKQEVMLSSYRHHSLHLDLSTRVLPQLISSSLPSTPSHSLGPERPLSHYSCSLTSIPVLESHFDHQSSNGLTPYHQHQDNAEGWSYRPFSQSSSVQSDCTGQKWKEGCKPLLSSGHSSPAYPDTTSLYSGRTTSSKSLHQVKRTSSSSSHSYTGRISLRKSKRPPPLPLRSDSLRRRPGCSKSSLTSSSTRQEPNTSPHDICLDPWVPRGNAKIHQSGMTCTTNVAFESSDLEATPTDEVEMLTFIHTSTSNSSDLPHLASPSSGYSSDSNTPLTGTPLSSPLTPPFSITPSPGVFSHQPPSPLTSPNISNPPVSLPFTLLHRKNSWTEGKQKPPVPERKSSLVSSHSSTTSLSSSMSPEYSCKGTLLLLPSAPASPPIPERSSSEKALIPCTYNQAPPDPIDPFLVSSSFIELSVASTSTTFSHLFTSLSPTQPSCPPTISPSVKLSLAPPAPPSPLPSPWQLASATYDQLNGAQSLPPFSLPRTTSSPPSSAKLSEMSFQPSPFLSYSSKPVPPISGPSVAPLVTYSTTLQELVAPHQTIPPISLSCMPEASSLSSAGPLLPPLPLPPPLPPLFLPMACSPSSAKVSVSPPPPPPLPRPCLPISTTLSFSATPFPPPLSPSPLFLHMSPLSSAKLSGDLSPQHLSLTPLPSSPQTSPSAPSSNISTPCPFPPLCPTTALSHCSTKLSELSLHPSLRLSLTAPPLPPPPPLPFSFRPSPPPYSYAVRQSPRNSIVLEQVISGEKMKGLLATNCVSRDINPNDLSNIDVKIGQVNVGPLVSDQFQTKHKADEKNPCSANRNTSITILVSKENLIISDPDCPRVKMSSDKEHFDEPCLQEEQEIKLSAEEPQNPELFCLAMSLDCIISASNQNNLQGKEKEIKNLSERNHSVASLKEYPKETTSHPVNPRFPQKPVLPKKPDLCILGLSSSPKAKPEPREKKPTDVATISCSGLQASYLDSTKQTSVHLTDSTYGSLVGSIKLEKSPVLHKKPNLNLQKELFRPKNILEDSESIFETTTGKIIGTNSTLEDCFISEALSTRSSSWNINAISRPWKSMENLSTLVNSGTHDSDTQITVTGPSRTWNTQETSLLNCDPNTMTETMCTEPLENSSILGNLKAPGSSTQTNCGSLIKDEEENKKMEKRQTPMMIPMNSSEKKKARKKRKMRVKRQLLMMSSTFEAFPSSLSPCSSSGEERDVTKNGTDQTEDVAVTFTPQMSDSEVSCTDQTQSCLSSALSTDRLSEDLSVPDLLIHEEEPEEEEREVGWNPDGKKQLCSLSLW